jgi:hypothetical protein
MSMGGEGEVAAAHDASTENIPAKPDAAPATKPVPAPKKAVQPIPETAGKALAPAEAPKAGSDSLDFTTTLTIKNPFGRGEVQVEEIGLVDVRAAGTTRAKGDAKDAELTDNLKEGTWVEFREKGDDDTRRPARLSYISPLKSSFLFVDRLGKTVKECSRAELARLFRLSAVVVMDEVPLFDRIMNGVVGKLR